MDNLKVLLIAGVASLVIASGVTYFRPVTKEIVREVIKEVSKAPALGAIPGNAVNSDRFHVNGVEHIYARMGFNTTGTTTVCSMAWPISENGGSTTLIHARFYPNTIGTSTTNPQFAIYKGIGLTSTTTVIAGVAVTATGTPVYATSTLDTSATATGGNASEFLVFDIKQGSVPFLPVNNRSGSCIAEWIGN